MNVRKIDDYLSDLPREQRISIRRRVLYFVITVCIIGLFCICGSEIYEQNRRERAVGAVISEHYSLICDGVEKKFTAHEFLSLTSKDLADYDTFRFDETTKTVYCKRPIVDLDGIIIIVSVPVILSAIFFLFYTEVMDRPLKEEDENKDDGNDEKV